MSNEENELLKLYESQYTGRLFEKANSYLLERNALFDEREKLYNLLDKIKEYCKNTINRYEDYIGKEDIVRENKFILKLLEEIE